MNKSLKWFVLFWVVLSVIGCSSKKVTGPVQYTDDSGTTPPTAYSASMPIPNPFSDTCVVILKVPYSTNINVSIKNSLYAEVKTIFSGHLVAGIYKYQWDGNNEQGVQCVNGFYYFTIMSDTFSCSSVVRLKR